jgi:hypothetical protein
MWLLAVDRCSIHRCLKIFDRQCGTFFLYIYLIVISIADSDVRLMCQI